MLRGRRWRGRGFGGGAVVGFDAVDDGAGVARLEGHDVFEVGAAPGVDALGVVADSHDAVVRAHEVDDLRLECVGVLILVHEEVLEAVREVGGDVGAFFKSSSQSSRRSS